MKKDKIDLIRGQGIPFSARTVSLAYKINSTGKALIYRFEGDQTPMVLHEPEGKFDINIPEDQKIFIELLDDGTWEIIIAGWSI